LTEIQYQHQLTKYKWSPTAAVHCLSREQLADGSDHYRIIIISICYQSVIDSSTIHAS